LLRVRAIQNTVVPVCAEIFIFILYFKSGACERKMYRVLVVKPEGKTPLGRPRRLWEDKIRMDLRDLGWGSGSVDSGQGPMAVSCKCGDEPAGSGATNLVSYIILKMTRFTL
jgi:hypothetical protein